MADLKFDDVVSATQISEIVGVTVGAVCNWASRTDDFPEPAKVYGRTKLYELTDVIKWLMDTGKILDYDFVNGTVTRPPRTKPHCSTCTCGEQA